MSTEKRSWELLVEIERLIQSGSRRNSDDFGPLLRQIGDFFKTDRVYLCLLNADISRLRVVQDWSMPGHASRKGTEIRLDASKNPVKALNTDPGSRLLHTSPLVQSGRLKGFLCFESYDSAYEWKSEYAILAEQISSLLTDCLSNAAAPFLTPPHPIVEKKTETSFDEDNGDIHILIVEDDESNIFLIRKIVERFGAVPHIAKTGREAIDACNQKQFDVILMDLSMPQLDGFDATREIVTGSNINSDTPIVAVTADTTEGIERRCKKVGMRHYLSKPLRMEAMLTILTELTQHKRALSK